MMSGGSSILALDVGGRRIGVASASLIVRIARPLVTVENNSDVIARLQKIIEEERAIGLVVGLPRNLIGAETEQTRVVKAFGASLEEVVAVPLYWQDEAVTSKKAEEELRQRGKPFSKGDIDALAATYILEDFLQEHPEVRV
jgi:putative Holliday junction resolvase